MRIESVALVRLDVDWGDHLAGTGVCDCSSTELHHLLCVLGRGGGGENARFQKVARQQGTMKE
jgi:hypothetical protein